MDEIFDENYVGHDLTAIRQETRGPEQFKEQTRGYRAAFPSLRFTIESLIAAGDEVEARWTARGTHQGDLEGITPTRKEVEVTGFDIWRIADGKIVEYWGNFDNMGLQQG